MKKIYALKILFKLLLFLAALILALWLFMPWKQIGEAFLLSASSRLPQPASLSYSSVERAGSGFTVHGLELEKLAGVLDLSFETFTVNPDIIGSIAGMAPACHVTFTGAAVGEISVGLKKMPGIAPGSGRVTVSLSGQGAFLDGLRSDGELTMDGSLLANPAGAKKIVWADVGMEIKSAPFEQNLQEIVMVLGLPLRQEGPGRWRLRRLRENESEGTP